MLNSEKFDMGGFFKSEDKIAFEKMPNSKGATSRWQAKTVIYWLIFGILLCTTFLLAFILVVREKEYASMKETIAQLQKDQALEEYGGFKIDKESKKHLEQYGRQKRSNGDASDICLCTGNIMLRFCDIVEESCEKGVTHCDTEMGGTDLVHWEIYEGEDCYGNDYEVRDDLTFDQCERKCKQDEECVAFNVLTIPEGRCWFKHTCDRNRFIETVVVNSLFVKVDPTGTMNII